MLQSTRWTSAASESANSRPPTFATRDRPRHWNVSLRLMTSSRTELMTSRRKSCVSFRSTEVTVYPTCFSAYLGELIRPTTFMWPKSTSYPSMKMYRSFHTYLEADGEGRSAGRTCQGLGIPRETLLPAV